MATWIAYVKETRVRRLTIEVEANDWEIAENKARDIAWATPDREWGQNGIRIDLDIDVEES